MKRKILVAVATLPIAMTGLAVLSYELRSTGSRGLFALYGLGAALLAAVAFGLLAIQLYVAIEAGPTKGLEDARRRFHWHILAFAGLLTAAVVWPVFDLVAFPAERAIDWQTLRVIQIAGGIGLAAILYWRFRSVRIHINPERSLEVKKKFAKWEGLFVRIVYLALLLPSICIDARRDYLQGHRIPVFLFAIFTTLIVATGIYLRVRIRLRQKRAAEIVAG